jgi:hypothetical protein
MCIRYLLHSDDGQQTPARRPAGYHPLQSSNWVPLFKKQEKVFTSVKLGVVPQSARADRHYCEQQR